MKTAYRVLAYLVALEVLVQAAAIAFATFGLLGYLFMRLDLDARQMTMLF